MNQIEVDPSWKRGRYTVVASSAAAEAEWKSFTVRAPEAARETFERLSSEPLSRQPERQFPLRGKANKPFWEYEASAADRVYYAVNANTGSDVADLIKRRRKAFDQTQVTARNQPESVKKAATRRKK